MGGASPLQVSVMKGAWSELCCESLLDPTCPAFELRQQELRGATGEQRVGLRGCRSMMCFDAASMAPF